MRCVRIVISALHYGIATSPLFIQKRLRVRLAAGTSHRKKKARPHADKS